MRRAHRCVARCIATFHFTAERVKADRGTFPGRAGGVISSARSYRLMTASSTFTVGLVQMAVTGDRATTVAAAIVKIREAAARGAQIISLQELFNAPYF